jgi:hypothetical protein
MRFAEGHFAGSLNVGLGNRMFAACVELFLPKQSQILLVVDKQEEASRAQSDLVSLSHRVPIAKSRSDHVRGSLSGQMRDFFGEQLK